MDPIPPCQQRPRTTSFKDPGGSNAVVPSIPWVYSDVKNAMDKISKRYQLRTPINWNSEFFFEAGGKLFFSCSPYKIKMLNNFCLLFLVEQKVVAQLSSSSSTPPWRMPWDWKIFALGSPRGHVEPWTCPWWRRGHRRPIAKRWKKHRCDGCCANAARPWEAWHTVYYPTLPNTSWEGVLGMFLGSKYLLARCLEA